MRPFLAAVQFLTALPVPESWCGAEKHLARSVPYFPAVGLLIGALMGLVDYGLRWLLPESPASVLTVIGLIAASGGLHLDGLADTADGMLSSRPKERILEIMKDSRTGAMGVAAVVCVVALKIALLSSVPEELRFGAVLMMPFAGRCSIVVMMSVLESARREGSLTAIFRRSPLGMAVSIGALLAVGSIVAGWAGLAAAALSLAASLVFAGCVRRKIGGFTGDTLGAACEIVEIAPVLVAAIGAHGVVAPM